MVIFQFFITFMIKEKLNKKKVPPPRPPPPKVQSLPIFSSPSAESITSMTSSISSTTLDYRPIPSPRKVHIQLVFILSNI